ncbi:hypothetical protein PAXRUDRAFT_28761 [Paxillus rubicundulus Ve08.2h10]|uniref:Uncharacterized protein n=1 Tax=Paxillus rubicundulus Ve08.2h10 TaxID=930991 RepID=A0A0D0CQQ0_9AGAM|nr:hypothetical protein PAXRUDRAFT_28761 [Paxillus rubicundulus Ve08.2h10]
MAAAAISSSASHPKAGASVPDYSDNNSINTSAAFDGAEDTYNGDVMSISGESRQTYQQVPETLRDYFKTEYHPKSSRPPVTKSFSTYGQTSAAMPPIVDQQPWQPYLSHLDFEFVELTHEAALSKEQTEQFLHLIWKITNGPLKFSFKSHSNVMTPSMLLRENSAPFVIILYADKTHLSSSGGVKDAQNCFWIVRYSNPHEILTFDPLHVDNIGFWGNHLFGQLKQHLNALGREFEKKLDDQHTAFPHWQNFNHFKSVTNISFSNGNKLLNISKQVLYTTQNILTHKQAPTGYALLMCIVYIALTKDNGKSGTFPRTYVAQMIHSQIDHLNEEQRRCILDRATLEDDESETLDTIEIQGHIYLGSSRVPAMFAEVEEAGSSNRAFLNFCKKLTLFINSFMAANNVPLPSGTSWLKPSAEDKIC